MERMSRSAIASVLAVFACIALVAPIHAHAGPAGTTGITGFPATTSGFTPRFLQAPPEQRQRLYQLQLETAKTQHADAASFLDYLQKLDPPAPAANITAAKKAVDELKAKVAEYTAELDAANKEIALLRAGAGGGQRELIMGPLPGTITVPSAGTSTTATTGPAEVTTGPGATTAVISEEMMGQRALTADDAAASGAVDTSTTTGTTTRGPAAADTTMAGPSGGATASDSSSGSTATATDDEEQRGLIGSYTPGRLPTDPRTVTTRPAVITNQPKEERALTADAAAGAADTTTAGPSGGATASDSSSGSTATATDDEEQRGLIGTISLGPGVTVTNASGTKLKAKVG